METTGPEWSATAVARRGILHVTAPVKSRVDGVEGRSATTAERSATFPATVQTEGAVGAANATPVGREVTFPGNVPTRSHRGGAEEEGESVMNVERRDTSPGIVLTKSHKGGVVEVEVEGESVMNVERRDTSPGIALTKSSPISSAMSKY